MDKKNNEVLLEIIGLKKNYDGLIALDDVNLSIKKGEVVVILGPYRGNCMGKAKPGIYCRSTITGRTGYDSSGCKEGEQRAPGLDQQ
jgi:ABC-type branched-subunit amino acid transport system ATPase component